MKHILKKLVITAIVLSLVLSMTAPAFAYPKEDPWVVDWSMRYANYDGTWKSSALIMEPELKKKVPSKWAAMEVYVAVSNNLLYFDEYDVEKDKMTALKPWTKNMTREDFVEVLYCVMYEIARHLEQDKTPGRESLLVKEKPEVVENVEILMYMENSEIVSKRSQDQNVCMEAYKMYAADGGKLDKNHFYHYVWYDREESYHPYGSPFTDTRDPVIEMMVRLGIVDVPASCKFRPNASITRAEAAVMIDRALAFFGIHPKMKKKQYSDTASLSKEKRDAIYTVSNIKDDRGKLVMGGSDGKWNPKAKFSNQRGMVIADRLYYYMLKQIKDYMNYDIARTYGLISAEEYFQKEMEYIESMS